MPMTTTLGADFAGLTIDSDAVRVDVEELASAGTVPQLHRDHETDEV